MGIPNPHVDLPPWKKGSPTTRGPPDELRIYFPGVDILRQPHLSCKGAENQTFWPWRHWVRIRVPFFPVVNFNRRTLPTKEGPKKGTDYWGPRGETKNGKPLQRTKLGSLRGTFRRGGRGPGRQCPHAMAHEAPGHDPFRVARGRMGCLVAVESPGVQNLFSPFWSCGTLRLGAFQDGCAARWGSTVRNPWNLTWFSLEIRKPTFPNLMPGREYTNPLPWFRSGLLWGASLKGCGLALIGQSTGLCSSAWPVGRFAGCFVQRRC